MAAMMLGRYLRKGLGGPADPDEAARWLNQALKLGAGEAAKDLAVLALAPPEALAVPVPFDAAPGHPLRAAGD
jgi:TPR repeat protein